MSKVTVDKMTGSHASMQLTLYACVVHMDVMKVARILNENYHDNRVYARSRGVHHKLYVFIFQRLDIKMHNYRWHIM